MKTNILRRSPDLMIDNHDGQFRIISLPKVGKYCRVGCRETSFLLSLPDEFTIEQIKISSQEKFTSEELEYLITWFISQGFVELKSTDTLVLEKATKRNFVTALRNLHNLRISLVNPNALLDKYLNFINCALSTKALIIYTLIFALAVFFVIFRPDIYINLIFGKPISFGFLQAFLLYVLLVITVALHELGHAITCKFFGGQVNKIGIGLMYFQVIFYCDVSDSWRFSEKWKKILVSASGIIVQIEISSITLLLATFFESPVLLYFTVLNILFIVLNSLPFIKLDGYWILVHLIDEPNLRIKGFKNFALMLQRLIGIETKKPDYKFAIFGLFSVIVTAIFSALALMAVYLLTAKYSISLAIFLIILIATALIFIAIKFAIHIFKTLH